MCLEWCPLLSLDVRVIYYGVMVIGYFHESIHILQCNYRYSQAQSSRDLFRPRNEARLYIKVLECLSLTPTQYFSSEQWEHMLHQKRSIVPLQKIELI